MRRGHPGASGGWLNDGPRHFRPRGGPPQNFRGSRGYGSQNTPRFPPPGPRFPGQNFGPRGGPPFEDSGPHKGRGHFNKNRSIFPRLQRIRQGFPHEQGPYPDKPFYNAAETPDQQRLPGGPPFGPWTNPPPQYYENIKRSFDEEPRTPLLQTPNNYGGHRPPASDHYGSNPAASNDNSETFSRSVDDTVDIVRKRLINRESHISTDHLITVPQKSDNAMDDTNVYESPARQEPAARKRHRPKNVKSNCDQMKNKIVHQLFMMDKDRIHKLMDNPSSSSKFEYAISNLITESQNSYNRHLRSMAEKNLDSSSSEFINQNNNSIYEDTFMKQMQCILEPQDTVLLEDIKPLVLAELQKVLQLNSDQNYGFEEQAVYPATDQSYYDPDFPSETNNEYPYNAFAPADESNRVDQSAHQYSNYENQDIDTKPLFERRHSRKSPESSHSKSKERSHRKHLRDKSEEEKSYRHRTPSSESRHRNKRRDEDYSYRNRTPSSDNSRSKDNITWGSRTPGRELACERVGQNDVWGSKTPGQEEIVWGTRHAPVPDDRSSGSKTPIREDRFKGSKTPIPEDKFKRSKTPITEDRYKRGKTPILEDRFKRSKTPITEDRYKRSKTPILEDRFQRSKTPIPEDRFRTIETPIPEDRFSGSNIPIPDDRFRGSHTPILEDRSKDRWSHSEDRYRGSKTSIPEDTFNGTKTPQPETRFSGSKTPISEDRFVDNKSPITEDKLAGSKTAIPEVTLDTSESPQRSKTPAPSVFDANANDLSDEDEAFAELDRQYHVAVNRDHLNYDLASPDDSFTHGLSKSPIPPPKEKTPERKPQKPIYIKLPKKPTPIIATDINNQLLNLAKASLPTMPVKVEPNEVNNEFESPDKNNQLHSPAKAPLITMPVKDEPSAVTNDLKSPDLSSLSDQTTPNTSERSESKENVSFHKDTSVNQNTSPGKHNTSHSRKRSPEHRSSHRKEKRKKLEPDSNKQILNKNIIINVNDCAAKNSDKCDAPKSVFNLFFSKEGRDANKDTKKSDKDISDKGRRKETKEKEYPKKSKESDNKKITTEQELRSPSASNTVSKTPAKDESKTKLKTFDMFEGYNKKPTIIRLNEPHKKAPVQVKSTEDANLKLGFGRKLTKRCVGTQVLRKIMSRETQTIPSKGCNCRDNKNLATSSVQTEPVSFKKASVTRDPFERMKEIDMEIQVLLQEKFTLYNSMESKDNCPSSLGMAVLNIETSQSAKNENTEPDLEDSIVGDFANIPVEELEQIAFESVGKMTARSDKSKKKKQVQKRVTPLSTSVKSVVGIKNKIKKKGKEKSDTPNISLIEQIISDDRPLEEIISLDDFEVTPVKKKYSKKTQPKKSQKSPAVLKNQTKQKGNILRHMIAKVECGIKECCVVLKREDLSKYMNKQNKSTKRIKHKVETVKRVKTPTEKVTEKSEVVTKTKKFEVVATKEQVKEIVSVKESQNQEEESAVIEEAVVNDIQFDMLDVSEDIVIGDNCEVKTVGSKNASDTSVSLCEDIIMDNSQSVVEYDIVPVLGPNDTECKLFDYSADENLKKDAITVVGHNDAVLAIECIDNNFIAACLDGNVYYFSGEGQLLATLRGSNLAVTCLTIVREKYGITVYTGSLDSRIRYYDLETGLEKGPEGNVLSPIQTMDRAWDTIFVGTRTGFVLQFECRNNMLIPVSTVKFSDQSILALRAMKEGPRKVLLVAARSEPVTIKDAQSGLLLRTLEGPKMTVYTLLFEDGKVYCGTSNHQIHVFDYTSGGHAGVHEGGKGAVCLRAAGGLVFAGCYDGCVYVYREGQPQPLAQLRGPGLMLLSLAVVGSKIIAGYKDRSLYIWKMPGSITSEMIL